MIYQHVNKRAKILPLANFHIAHLCKQFSQVCTTNFYATLKSIIFYQYSPKIKLILKKMQNFQALRAPPPTPVLPAAGGFAPRPPKQPPQLRISSYVPATFCTVYNYMGFCSFCFEQFFFIVQLQTLRC